MSKYKINAESSDGSTGFSETFNHLFFVLRAAKTAVKAGLIVKIEKL
jgi:hypothetical protein